MVASKLEISFLIVVVVPLLVIRSVTFPYRSYLRSLKDLNFLPVSVVVIIQELVLQGELFVS